MVVLPIMAIITFVLPAVAVLLLIAALVLSIVVMRRARVYRERHDELQRLVRARAREEDARLQLTAIVEDSPDLIASFLPNGELLYLNHTGRRLLGIADTANLRGISLTSYQPDWAKALVKSDGIPTATRHRFWHGETCFIRKDGSELSVSQAIYAHMTEMGTITRFSTVARDISDRKQFESRLTHLASHDTLTNLLNRRRFEEEVERQLSQDPRLQTTSALILLDLDNFRGVNDSLGHHAGDEVLQSVTEVLKEGLRAYDVLARVGGDEFGLYFPETSIAQAEMIADRILRSIRQHAAVVGGQPMGITASIGVAMYPIHGQNAEELFAHADLAMYRAKENGRNCISIERPERETVNQPSTPRAWEKRIRESIEQNGFLLYLQPIEHLITNQRQFEVLLRMKGQDAQPIAPGTFLGVAERSGLIRDIDRWVVREAIQLIAAMQARGEDVCLEVNLSGKAFADAELLPLITRELARTGINPELLTLEITETAAIADMDQARRFISTLKGFGCRMALDDFGVGFSSFSYLKQLPVDYLKIDGSFIRNLPNDPVDQHLVKAIVEVARGLDKLTIAEFVGDAATVELLREYGVDYGQGYHIGKPRPAAEVLNLYGDALAPSTLRPRRDTSAAATAPGLTHMARGVSDNNRTISGWGAMDSPVPTVNHPPPAKIAGERQGRWMRLP